MAAARPTTAAARPNVAGGQSFAEAETEALSLHINEVLGGDPEVGLPY
jgi:hypothetical protein